jgi:hypothetical protein
MAGSGEGRATPSACASDRALDGITDQGEHVQALALEFAEKRGGGWSASYRLRFDRFMEGDAFPYIGALPIASVIAPHILEILQRVEERGAPSTAVLGRGLIGQVFNYAIAAGR